MDWDSVLQTNASEVENDETLLQDLYAFFLHHDLPRSLEEGPPQLQSSEDLLTLLHILKSVMRLKGLDAQAAEEELKDLHVQCQSTTSRVSASEGELISQLVQLEQDLRYKDDIINQLREQIGRSSPTVSASQIRYLRDENEDLMQELKELRHSIGQERSEKERLMQAASSERLKAHQLEKDLVNMRHNCEDYKKQLDWQRERGRGSRAEGTGEADFRLKLKKKDLEMAEQLDKIEELLDGRDNLEQQLRDLTLQLGRVEEQRLSALKDAEKMKSVLVESDKRGDEMETKNKVLEGKISDLQEKLSQQSGVDDHIVSLVNAKAQEWEALLAAKDEEVVSYREKVKQLEGKLQTVRQDSNHKTLLNMKKELQDREAELLMVQNELSEATTHISTLTSQLERVQSKGDPALLNTALKQELENVRKRLEVLESDLGLEVQRREQAELEKEERDVQLTQALKRLGEYERGEYGLYEAVMEIKGKKEELAIRDKDIAELTQHINQLENQLDHYSEENETLRVQAGLGVEDKVDTSGVKGRRIAELEKLRRDNRMLEKEVEQLGEDKYNLRKHLLDHAISKGSSVCLDHVDMGGSHGTPCHAHSLVELGSKVWELEKSYQEERRGKEVSQNEVGILREQFKQAQEKLRQYEKIVKELRKVKELQGFKSEALDRLIALLEVEGSGDNVATTLQLKSKLSELIGQKEMLTQQLQCAEDERRQALKELERRQCEMEKLSKEVSDLRKLQSGYQPLPLPEGMALSTRDVVTSLNEQLLHALEQLHSREEDLEEVKRAMERLQRKFGVIIHQQGILYQEYSEGRGKWEEDSKRGRLEREKIMAEWEKDKVKVQELEALQASLAGGEEEMKIRLGEMSRRLTVLLVNEKILGRKQQLLEDGEVFLKKENSVLLRDKIQMEKTITEKIAYLQRHKETALFKLSSLQQQLSDSVPNSLLVKANHQYNQLAVKYQQMLSEQSAYTTTTAHKEQLQADLHTLSRQLDEVKQELSLEKQKNRLLCSAGGGTGQEAGVGGGGKGSDQAMAKQVTTLEMKVLNEQQRGDLATSRCEQLREVVLQLEARNTTLEKNFSELTQRLLQAQVTEGELRDELASCLPSSEKSLLDDHIAQLSKSVAELNIENSKLKEVAEVARQQGITVEMMQKSHDLEVSSLRTQLLDLQGVSDERTADGRLYHQILTLQISESTALKRLEEAEARIVKLEAYLLRSEQERDRANEAVFQCRSEAIGRVKRLRDTIQSLRRQYSGAIPLSESEHYVKLLQKARVDQKEAGQLREDARKDRDLARDKVLELEVQKSNLEELIAAIRDSSQDHTQKDPQSCSAAARLTEWHAKLGELRLVELRVTRTNQQLQERVKHLEDLVTESERSFSKLEHELVSVTKDYEANQLSWEQKEAQLEKQLEAAPRNSMRNLFAQLDPQLSPTEQLEEVLRQLQELLQEKEALSQKVRDGEKETSRLETALGHARAEILEREGEVVRMTGEVEALRRALNQAEISEKEVNETSLNLALESVKQLQAQLLVKEELAEKYQQMMQDARRDLQKELSAHKEEVATLGKKLDMQTNSTFSRLKEAALEAVNMPQAVVPTNQQLERLLELEDLTLRQEKDIKVLNQKVTEVQQDKEMVEQLYEGRIAKIKQESRELTQQYRREMEGLRSNLSNQTSRVKELEQEVEVLEGELSAAQQAAKQAPSRTMRALVERLRNQLSIKEKQQRALSQALLQVRADLVETAQKTLEGEAGRELQEKNIQYLVDQRTNQLQEQLDEISSRLASQEKEGLEEVSRLEDQLETEKKELVKARTEIEKKTAEVEEKTAELQAAEEKLNQQLQKAEKDVWSNPKVLELQKRSKVLQGKVNKQNEKIQKLEKDLEALSRGGVKGVASNESVHVDKTSLIDSKHQAVEVMRWEEGKKWQKKLDVLRNKLAEKTGEVEAALKQISSLKEMQNRNEREKSLLQSKIKSLQKQVSESGGQAFPDHQEEENSRPVGGHSVVELERVIGAMRKVIEKQQVDNETLKRSNAAARIGQGGKKMALLQEENAKLKAELEKLQGGMVGGASTAPSLKSPYTKIVVENDRLRKDLKKEVARAEKLQLSLTTLQMQKDKFLLEAGREDETTPLPSSASGEVSRCMELEVRVEELQAEVDKKTAMLMEVKKHLKEAAEREKELKSIYADPQLSEKFLAIMKERDDQKQVIAQMKKELDSFDPSFFEEIEDLKFNYQEAVKMNVELKYQLTRLTGNQESSTSIC